MDDVSNIEKKILPLKTIVQLQTSGSLQEAHDAYIAYIEASDIDYRVLNLFGVCCLSLGKFQKAQQIFEHITASTTSINEALFHLIEAHIGQGNLDAALGILDSPKCEILERETVLLTKARILMMQKDISAAQIPLKEVLELDTGKIEALLMLADCHMQVGAYDEALNLQQRVLFEEPGNENAMVCLAQIYHAKDDASAVLNFSKKVIELFPRNISAQKLYCWALHKKKRWDDYLEATKNLAILCPDDPEALKMLSSAHWEKCDYHSCIVTCSRVLSFDPHDIASLYLAATSYFKLGFQNQALDKLEQLLILNPNDVRALQNKAVIFERFNLIDEAVAIYDRILEIEPEKSTTLFNKSMCYLTKGWFKEGFNLYESRFNRETQLLSNYVGDEPVWTGKQSLQGKHLLVHPEQGLGDTILMSRFVNYIEDHGAKITFAVQKPLHSIMETFETRAKVVAAGAQVDRIDYHVPLMSLPHLTDDKWQCIPIKQKYLKAPKKQKNKWAERLGAPSSVRVGFVCSGNPEHNNDLMRSINMSTFLSCLPEGPDYFLLQKDLRNTDKAALVYRDDVRCFNEEIEDFADTAALCELMDLVVSVDTSVIHLAGALGVPSLVMLSTWPDWRWGSNDTPLPWYESVRTVRQIHEGDWSTVLDMVRLEIENLQA